MYTHYSFKVTVIIHFVREHCLSMQFYFPFFCFPCCRRKNQSKEKKKKLLAKKNTQLKKIFF